jgi:hypothetical protein
MAAELTVGIGVDLKELQSGLDKATKQFEGFGAKLSNIGTLMTVGITAPLILAAKQMIKLSSDAEEATNKVDVAFGKSSDMVKKFASKSLTSFGIAKGSAMDMAAGYGDMATSMGLTQDQAAQMSTSLVGLGADLASFKNISLDQSKTALNGIFTGETESLKMLGIVMTDANLKAYALSQGFKGNTDQLTQGEKVLLRYNYILDNTKNAQGDFARTGGGAANQMRIFGESLKEIGSSFGAIILPYFTKGITYINNLIIAFGSLGDGAKKAILIVAGIAAATGPILMVIGKVVELGSKLAFLVTPVGLFAAAMGATAIYVLNNWEKVRKFFYDFEMSFLKFKTNLGGALVALGVIDAKTAFGDMAAGFKNVSRWASDSKDGVQGFKNEFTKTFSNVKSLLSLDGLGGSGGGGKTPLGKALKEDTMQMSLLGLETQQTLDRIKKLQDETARIKGDKIGNVSPIQSLAFNPSGLSKENKGVATGLMDELKGVGYNDLLKSSGDRLESAMNGLKDRIITSIANVQTVGKDAWTKFGENFGMSAEQAMSRVQDIVSIGVDGLANLMASGLGNLFNQNVEFDPKNMIAQVLKSVGQMIIGIATPLIAALILGNTATFGGMSVQAGAAIGMLAAGVGMTAGGMALSSSSSGNVSTSSGSVNAYNNARSDSGFNNRTMEVRFANGALKGYTDSQSRKYN